MTIEFRYDDWKDEKLSDFCEDLKRWRRGQKYADRADDKALILDMDGGDGVAIEVAGNKLYRIQGQPAALEEDDLVLTDEGPYLVIGEEIREFDSQEETSYAVGRGGGFQSTLYCSYGPEAQAVDEVEVGEPGSAPAQVSDVSTYMWSEEPGTVSVVNSAMNEVKAVLESGKRVEV